MAVNALPSPEEDVCTDIYIPEADIENYEGYAIAGYHPAKIGDTFHHGRYEIVHKLGFGGYSTVWLACDRKLQRYVSLKILVARQSSKSTEGRILRMLHSGGVLAHPGRRFIPHLLDEFSFDGPNGHHTCLVQEPAGCSVAESKEDSVDFMFPVETARSMAAQLIMGVSYLHSRGLCHGDLHLRNFLLRGPDLNKLSPNEIYERYPLDTAPISRFDGAAVEPHAPQDAIFPLFLMMRANKVVDPVITILDYGTSFFISTATSPELHTPALYLPPEDFFNESITQAADIWTLGVSLYEVLGERALFDTFRWDPDYIIAEMISTLGTLPTRWWDRWGNCFKEFFEPDGSYIRNLKSIYPPVFRRLHQRMWDMGRGKTPETC